MGYNALNKCVEKRPCSGRTGCSALNNTYTGNGLKECALRFIRENCTDLRFEDKEENAALFNFKGTGLNENQIPYNLQMDTDRLCLENSVKRFLGTGRKEDAFDVYFCYIEMFLGKYKDIGRIIELISEFELNGSRLLMKHRDHYSHSVYVFILGLAIYESNSFFKSCYQKKYFGDEKNAERKAAHHFLKYWGFASLFHDVGYPFELPFEQVCSYFETNGSSREKRPYIAYHGMDPYVKLNKSTQRRLAEIYGLGTDKILSSTDELFAYVLAKDLSEEYYFSEKDMLDILRKKPSEPNKFGYFIDHGYFSATVLFKKLFCDFHLEFEKEHIDALSAIILHNSLYKFSVAFYKDKYTNIPFRAELHPLAFMLMLCDELQCWDRSAYGRNSKLEIHPMDCKFDFSGNGIKATYIFDEACRYKTDEFDRKMAVWMNTDAGESKPPRLKAYSDMKYGKGSVSDFLADIQNIVDLSNIRISTEVEFSQRKKASGTLSNSNFINLYHFAEVLNGRYSKLKEWINCVHTGTAEVEKFLSDKKNISDFESGFEKLSLEYKLSNINQAKAFDAYLNKIGCFYSDRDIDFEFLEEFDIESMKIIGPMEHGRWVNEHLEAGWGYISNEELSDLTCRTFNITDKDEKFGRYKKMLRENLRLHPDMPVNLDNESADEAAVLKNYARLSKAEQDKDTDPMNCMLTMLRLYDGLRIYKLN